MSFRPLVKRVLKLGGNKESQKEKVGRTSEGRKEKG